MPKLAMTLALLFPGQGVQHPAMLPWLEDEPAARPVLDGLAVRLGDDWRARSADAAWATRNRIAQPLIVGLALAAWAALRSRLAAPAVVAGYSVGELAACAAVGVFDAATALELASQRAAAMDASGAAVPGGLAAVAGLPVAEVAALCGPYGVTIALRNAADRCVIGGPRDALQSAMRRLVERGAELTVLPIGVASHTPAMASATEAFGRTLAPLDLRRPAALVVTGRDGRGTRDPTVLREALAAQISTPVEWATCLETLAERRPRGVLEVGPGSSLARMWTAAFPHIPARSVDEFRHADAVVAWVEGLGAG